MIIHYSSRAERRRDLASPCSQNTLCDALQVATMINDHGGGLQAYDDDDSMYNWVDDDTAMSMRVVQDYSGWASYMGAGAILCCLASALAGIILKVSFYVFLYFHQLYLLSLYLSICGLLSIAPFDQHRAKLQIMLRQYLQNTH